MFSRSGRHLGAWIKILNLITLKIFFPILDAIKLGAWPISGGLYTEFYGTARWGILSKYHLV